MKRLYVILFLIFCFYGFANQTYDDTKFRQDLVNWASTKVGATYDMNNRWGSNTFDCSSLVGRGIKAAGMTSISGKSSDYGTTANGLYQGSGKIISKNDYDSLKPGDIVHFSPYSAGTTGHVGIVVRNLGNGQIEMIDARNSASGVVRRIKDLSKDSHYLGATSATQILINNGYIPVNANGVVTAPAGSAVSSGAGAGNELVGMSETGYIVDFDGVLAQYTEVFKQGLNNLAQTLIVLLTFLAMLDFMYFYITDPVKDLELMAREFVARLFKFFIILLVIRNINNINDYAFKLCFQIAEVFVGEPKYLLNDVFTSYLDNCKGLLVFFSKISILDILTGQLTFKITMVIGFIIALTVIFCMIMGQIVINLMNFIVGINISCIFLPFRYSNYTHGYFPDPFAVMINNCLKLIVNIILVSVSLKIIGMKAIPDTTVNDFDIAAIMCFIVYFGITAVVLFKVNKRLANII